MNILIVAATPFEIAPFVSQLEQSYKKTGKIAYRKGDLSVQVLVTGIGLTHTAYALGRYLGSVKIDLAINIGIAGAFDRNLQLGQVVHVTEDSFADLGIEQADASFQNLFDAELIEPNTFPFLDGKLKNQVGNQADFLPKVIGTSVNTVHGSAASIVDFQKQNPTVQIESMEGAAFFYARLPEKIPFLQIRSISNYVEKRDKSNWNIPLAIENLNVVLWDML